MVITVIGVGYVGLVTAACFAEMGNTVICVDSNTDKIDGLRVGQIPIHEPGLDTLVTKNAAEGRLRFTTDLESAAAESEVLFIAVGTPPASDGSADLTHVLDVARKLGTLINSYSVIVSKSTVPVGTSEKIRAAVSNGITKRGAAVEFDVVSNPEFLKEGAAIDDFMRPDRIVLGSESSKALEIMRRLYAPFTRNHDRILTMGLREAEMTKYASNAMLATRISFINEIADLCTRLEVDVESVRKGIGADPRIGHAFIYPGCGYGGSCFPKDVRALVHMGSSTGVDMRILQAVDTRNALQKRRLFDMLSKRFGTDLSDRRFCIWGLAYKPQTDDIREAPSLTLIGLLAKAGASISVYDPIAMENARNAVDPALVESGRLTFAADQYAALDQADALLLVTEWKPFRNPDFQRITASLRHPIVFDGRNQYDPQYMVKLGFEYYGIGRGECLSES